ncbi:MAG: glycosyltransferase family 2 protein [Actinomycetia bacterium]|nr:glycosyltransferase family 2 protein [Actinomycetes bacterium]
MEDRSLIIIITYNSESFIEGCLKSVVGQTYKNWKLIVADNDSSDDTIRIIRDLRNQTTALNGDNFRLIHLKKNIGFAGAVNHVIFRGGRKAIRKDDFKYLILLNPDISLFPDALENLIASFEPGKYGAKSGIGACGGLILEYERNIIQHIGGRTGPNFITHHEGAGQEFYGKGHGKDGGDPKNHNDPPAIQDKSSLIKADYVTGAFFATVLSLFYDSGGFDRGYRPMYFEELDYCLRIKRAGWRVASNPGAICRHFEGASVGKFSKRFYRYYHKNRLRCVVINMGLPGLLLKFIPAEISWLRSGATGDQAAPLAYAYIINIVFFIYNLAVRIKNYFILNRIELK